MHELLCLQCNFIDIRLRPESIMVANQPDVNLPINWFTRLFEPLYRWATFLEQGTNLSKHFLVISIQPVEFIFGHHIGIDQVFLNGNHCQFVELEIFLLGG